MSLDLELESWRREWSVETEPLPELKRRVRSQNRRLIVGASALVCSLVVAVVIGLRNPFDSAWGGFAVGMALAVLVAGGYAVWARRGTWEPTAQTTSAYLELLHRRAVADLRKIVFLRRCLLVVLIAFGAFVLWKGRHVTMRAGLVFVGLVLETVWMSVLERRRRRAVDDAAALVDRTGNGA